MSEVNPKSLTSLTSLTSLSRAWCFTWNNPDCEGDEVEAIFAGKGMDAWAFQLERGESGTPHFQGCFRFKTQKEFTVLKSWWPTWHLEKCKDWRASSKYCTKLETRVEGPWLNGVAAPPSIAPDRFKLENPYPWQQKILDIVAEVPDKRTIHWIWEGTGGAGKTALAKQLCATGEALYVSGKANDIKSAIAACTVKPRVVIFGVPRTAESDMAISWAALEEVKDGLFFNGKYESGMVVMDCPHVFVFANFPPDMSKMSADRWNVVHIGEVWGGAVSVEL